MPPALTVKKFLLASCLVLLACAGCARKEAPTAAAPAHHHQAPHGGVLVELGHHEANLEFRFDAARGVLQAWMLDGHAENFVRSSQPGFAVEARVGGTVQRLQFAAVANPLTGETIGQTASFEAEAAWLRTVKAFDGRVKEVTVRDVVYRDVAFTFTAHDTFPAPGP